MERTDFTRRLLITASIAGVGALTGAAAATTLNFVSAVVIQGSDPSGLVFYHWKPGAFAVAGAIAAPLLAWSVLRRAPVWRVVAEPAAAATVAAIATLALAPWMMPIAVPVAAAAAVARLRWATAKRRSRALPAG
jgi:hypothetical protein